MKNDERKDGILPEEPKSSPQIEVQIVRHKQLFDILKNPSEMWRVLLSLFIIIVVLFFGLSCVVLSVKSIYPYNAIQTNMYGATTMKNEDKEVIYWLFNTAELWANSGIKVQEGDELTIRASGASHTAIHHLVQDVNSNRVPRDKWINTEGKSWNDWKDENNKAVWARDKARRKYRICKDHEEGKLLMQILPEDDAKADMEWIENYEIIYEEGKEQSKISINNKAQGFKPSIEIIGKGREKLRIKKDGVLHFAVNDIILTDTIITQMYTEFLNSLGGNFEKFRTRKDEIIGILDSIKGNPKKDYIWIDSLQNINDNILKEYITDSIVSYCKNNNLALGRYPKIGKASVTAEKYHNAYPLVNELVYYKEKKFRDAWYIDNLGSFLIVIERKKP